MKHQIIYASLFTAAIGFTACEAEKFDNIDNQPAEITVIAKAADNETSRTIFEEGKEGYSVKWDANNKETLKLLFVNVNENGSYSNNGHYTPNENRKEVIVTPDDDSSTGTFSFTPQGKDGNLVWVIYPYEGVANDITPFYSPDKNVYIDIPTEQAGRPKMPAAAASLMFGQFNYPEGYGTDNDNIGTPLTCKFEHLAAYGKINLKSFPAGIAGRVRSIVLSVEDENANLTGEKYIYNVEQKTISAGTFKLPNNGTSETEPKSYVKVSYGDDYKSGDAIMFAVAPSGDEGYKSLKLTVTFFNGSTYEKTLDASNNPVTFKKGLVSVLNISLADAQPPVVATE